MALEKGWVLRMGALFWLGAAKGVEEGFLRS